MVEEQLRRMSPRRLLRVASAQVRVTLAARAVGLAGPAVREVGAANPASAGRGLKRAPTLHPYVGALPFRQRSPDHLPRHTFGNGLSANAGDPQSLLGER